MSFCTIRSTSALLLGALVVCVPACPLAVIDEDEVCDDGEDNDLDGNVDCDDADCAREDACDEPGEGEGEGEGEGAAEGEGEGAAEGEGEGAAEGEGEGAAEGEGEGEGAPEPYRGTGIASVYAADRNNLEVQIAGAVVTLLKPAVGSEGAGFFLQEASTGPAIFVAIDPATLTPPAAVGDALSFTATARAITTGQTRITALDLLVPVSQGFAVETYRQDLSAAGDLVSALGSYESELLVLEGITTSSFGFAGAGHSSIAIDTAALAAQGNNLKVRVPDTVVSALGTVVPGCEITVRGAMWRYNGQAQPSAWTADGVSLGACASAELVSASALGNTQVILSFSRDIDPSSGAVAGNYSVTDGAVASASVSGSTVTLTMVSALADGSHTVTVSASVLDVLGLAVGPQDASVEVGGVVPPFFSELDYDSVNGTDPDTAEFVELFNPGTRTFDLAGMQLIFINGESNPVGALYRTFDLTGSIPAQARYVVGNVGGANLDPTPDTGLIQNGTPDGVVLWDNNTNSIVTAVGYETGAPLPAIIEGATYSITDVSSASDSNTVQGALCRTLATDPLAFCAGAPTPGT